MSFSLLVGAAGMVGMSLWPQAAQKSPYAGLFGPPSVQSQTEPPGPVKGAIVTKPKHKIVCGMVVFEADPNIDPKIRIPIPKQDVHYAIRLVPRRECK